MKKLFLFPVLAFALCFTGCGKKKEAVKTQPKEKKKVSSLFSQAPQVLVEPEMLASSDIISEIEDIPVYTNETENLLAEDTVADFAFVEEDDFTRSNDVAGEKLAFVDEDIQAEAVNLVDNEDLFASMPLAEEEEDKDLLVSIQPEIDYEFERVEFDFNKNKIKDSQVEKVVKNVEEAKKAVSKGKTVVISGHTCQVGSASYNLALSLKRAEAVKKEMIKAGLPQSKVKILGKGYETPLVWSDETDRLKKIRELSPNRRAEVIVN